MYNELLLYFNIGVFVAFKISGGSSPNKVFPQNEDLSELEMGDAGVNSQINNSTTRVFTGTPLHMTGTPVQMLSPDDELNLIDPRGNTVKKITPTRMASLIRTLRVVYSPLTLLRQGTSPVVEQHPTNSSTGARTPSARGGSSRGVSAHNTSDEESPSATREAREAMINDFNTQFESFKALDPEGPEFKDALDELLGLKLKLEEGKGHPDGLEGKFKEIEGTKANLIYQTDKQRFSKIEENVMKVLSGMPTGPSAEYNKTKHEAQLGEMLKAMKNFLAGVIDGNVGAEGLALYGKLEDARKTIEGIHFASEILKELGKIEKRVSEEIAGCQRGGFVNLWIRETLQKTKKQSEEELTKLKIRVEGSEYHSVSALREQFLERGRKCIHQLDEILIK